MSDNVASNKADEKLTEVVVIDEDDSPKSLLVASSPEGKTDEQKAEESEDKKADFAEEESSEELKDEKVEAPGQNGVSKANDKENGTEHEADESKVSSTLKRKSEAGDVDEEKEPTEIEKKPKLEEKSGAESTA